MSLAGRAGKRLLTVGGQDAQQTTGTQCFTTDPVGRLTEAWTAKSTCTTTPAKDTVGGPDAYWQSYTYDKLGNRTEQTEHSTTTGTDATTTYTHPAPGADRPHAVQQGPPSQSVPTTPRAGRTTVREVWSLYLVSARPGPVLGPKPGRTKG